jgi:hypothetical protein
MMVDGGFAPPPTTIVIFLLVILGVQAALTHVAFRAGGMWGLERRRALTVAFGFLVAMLASAALVWSGLLRRTEGLPGVLVYLVAVVTVTGSLGLGKVGAAAAGSVAPLFWVAFHSYRLPLELVLAQWHRSGFVPEQLTWNGQNWDILTGILAITISAVYFRSTVPRRVLISFQLFGLLMLGNVIRIVVFSLPTPLQRFQEAVYLPYYVPTTWIVPFALGPALFGHIVGIRAALRKQS